MIWHFDLIIEEWFHNKTVNKSTFDGGVSNEIIQLCRFFQLVDFHFHFPVLLNQNKSFTVTLVVYSDIEEVEGVKFNTYISLKWRDA